MKKFVIFIASVFAVACLSSCIVLSPFGQNGNADKRNNGGQKDRRSGQGAGHRSYEESEDSESVSNYTDDTVINGIEYKN